MVFTEESMIFFAGTVTDLIPNFAPTALVATEAMLDVRAKGLSSICFFFGDVDFFISDSFRTSDLSRRTGDLSRRTGDFAYVGDLRFGDLVGDFRNSKCGTESWFEDDVRFKFPKGPANNPAKGSMSCMCSFGSV